MILTNELRDRNLGIVATDPEVNMPTAQILNIVGISCLILALIFGIPILLYLSIAFITASIIYWRKKSKGKNQNT